MSQTNKRYETVILSSQGPKVVTKTTDIQREAIVAARGAMRTLEAKYSRFWSLQRRVVVYDSEMSPGTYVHCPRDLVTIQGGRSKP